MKNRHFNDHKEHWPSTMSTDEIDFDCHETLDIEIPEEKSAFVTPPVKPSKRKVEFESPSKNHSPKRLKCIPPSLTQPLFDDDDTKDPSIRMGRVISEAQYNEHKKDIDRKHPILTADSSLGWAQYSDKLAELLNVLSTDYRVSREVDVAIRNFSCDSNGNVRLLLVMLDVMLNNIPDMKTMREDIIQAHKKQLAASASMNKCDKKNGTFERDTRQFVIEDIEVESKWIEKSPLEDIRVAGLVFSAALAIAREHLDFDDVVPCVVFPGPNTDMEDVFLQQFKNVYVFKYEPPFLLSDDWVIQSSSFVELVATSFVTPYLASDERWKHRVPFEKKIKIDNDTTITQTTERTVLPSMRIRFAHLLAEVFCETMLTQTLANLCFQEDLSYWAKLDPRIFTCIIAQYFFSELVSPPTQDEREFVVSQVSAAARDCYTSMGITGPFANDEQHWTNMTETVFECMEFLYKTVDQTMLKKRVVFGNNELSQFIGPKITFLLAIKLMNHRFGQTSDGPNCTSRLDVTNDIIKQMKKNAPQFAMALNGFLDRPDTENEPKKVVAYRLIRFLRRLRDNPEYFLCRVSNSSVNVRAYERLILEAYIRQNDIDSKDRVLVLDALSKIRSVLEDDKIGIHFKFVNYNNMISAPTPMKKAQCTHIQEYIRANHVHTQVK